MIRREHQPWIGAGGVLLVLGTLGLKVPSWFQTTGKAKYLLTGGLLVFAIALAVVTLLFLRARLKARKEAQVEGAEDIDQAIAAAQSRLASSALTADARIARLPLALVLGPVGSTKTSVLTHSGLDPELLSGEVMRGDAVVPTAVINVWYAHGTILVEAGGRLLDDAQRWRRLAHHLRPRRLAAAIGRGRQAPRAAIVCIGCDEFHKPGASQSLAAIARQLRTRLTEVSQQLGIRLPVYVLFTRADRLQPHFGDYLRSFTNEEAQQVLGATLPLASDTGAAWAERESKRLNDAFARIVRSLATRRLDVLARENDEAVRASAYEFPRELRKLTEPAVQLLLDVFRPSQLGVNPFLRGFYFTGVRPVILRDLASEPAMIQQPGAPSYDPGATSVFNPAMLRQMPQQVPVINPSGRKVPQWVFLNRLFQEVLLRDATALRVTGGGRRVDMMRRALIGSIAAAGVVFSLGFTISFFSNGSAIKHGRRVVQLAAASANETEDAQFAALDTLRERTHGLRSHGFWLWSGWGLNQRDTVRQAVRASYFNLFDRLLWAQTRTRLTEYLNNLPPFPDPHSNVTRAYDALTGYLLTTREDTLDRPAIVEASLMNFWARSETADTFLVKRQFHFFGEELPLGNPYAADYDSVLVEKTRGFLRGFGPDAYYQSLISEANEQFGRVAWTEQAAVQNGVSVGGAFTQLGWNHIDGRLENLDEFIQSREWVFGKRPPARPDRDSLARRYERDYIEAWQVYLAAARMSFSHGDASQKLTLLSDGNASVFKMLSNASINTRMRPASVLSADSINAAFKPLHAIVPSDQNAGPASLALSYKNALDGLRAAFVGFTNAPGADAALRDASTQIGAEISPLIARADSLNARASTTVNFIQKLLQQPILLTNQIIGGIGPATVNAAGTSFCGVYSAVQSRFPFRAGGEDAPLQAVAGIFNKDDGALTSLYQGTLEPYLSWSGRPKTGAPHTVGRDFQGFFTTAAEFSDAVFGSNAGAGIEFSMVLNDWPDGTTDVTLRIDGTPSNWSPTARDRQILFWQPGQAVTLSIKAGGVEKAVAQGPGVWGLFRLFQSTSWDPQSDGRYSVRWTVPGSALPLVMTVGMTEGRRPVMRPQSLRTLSGCPRILN